MEKKIKFPDSEKNKIKLTKISPPLPEKNKQNTTAPTISNTLTWYFTLSLKKNKNKIKTYYESLQEWSTDLSQNCNISTAIFAFQAFILSSFLRLLIMDVAAGLKMHVTWTRTLQQWVPQV